MRRLCFCLITLLPLNLAANCQDPMTQADMNACAGKTYQAADKELNRVYKIIVKTLDKAENKKLRTAQRAWIKYRDANCEHQNFSHEGGSIYPTLHSHCLADVTNARSNELKRIYPDLFSNPAQLDVAQLVGDWQSQSDTGLIITFSEEAEARVFRSFLHQRPFEVGHWQLLDGQLMLTELSGGLLRLYNQVVLTQDNLRLTEQDGTQEVLVRKTNKK